MISVTSVMASHMMYIVVHTWTTGVEKRHTDGSFHLLVAIVTHSEKTTRLLNVSSVYNVLLIHESIVNRKNQYASSFRNLS